MVSAKATVHKANLLILIENPYAGVIVMKGGLPQSSLEGHGYGTSSIAAIADAHGGQAIFSAGNTIPSFSMPVLHFKAKLHTSQAYINFFQEFLSIIKNKTSSKISVNTLRGKKEGMKPDYHYCLRDCHHQYHIVFSTIFLGGAP